MGTFENLLNKAKRGAESVGQKTGDFVEVTKLKMALSDLEKEISDNFECLGRMVYDNNKSGNENAEAIDACIENIDKLEEAAEAIREQIFSYKNLERCVACGEVIEKNAAFCSKCGTPLTVAEAPAQEAPAEETEE